MEAILYKFNEKLNEGEICGRKCRHCGKVIFPPRGLCSECGSDEFDWVALSGNCRILSIAGGESGFYPGCYFLLATVELEEGPYVMLPYQAELDDNLPTDFIWEYYDAVVNTKGKLVVGTNPEGVKIVTVVSADSLRPNKN